MEGMAWFSTDGRSWEPLGDPVRNAFFTGARLADDGLLLTGATQAGTLETGVEALRHGLESEARLQADQSAGFDTWSGCQSGCRNWADIQLRAVPSGRTNAVPDASGRSVTSTPRRCTRRPRRNGRRPVGDTALGLVDPSLRATVVPTVPARAVAAGCDRARRPIVPIDRKSDDHVGKPGPSSARPEARSRGSVASARTIHTPEVVSSTETWSKAIQAPSRDHATLTGYASGSAASGSIGAGASSAPLGGST